MEKQNKAPVKGLDLVVSNGNEPGSDREKSGYRPEVTGIKQAVNDVLPISKQYYAEPVKTPRPMFVMRVGGIEDGLQTSHSWKDSGLGPEWHDGFVSRAAAEADWAEAHFKANLMAELAALDLALDLPMLSQAPRPRRVAGWAAAGIAESKWREVLTVAELDGGTSQAACLVQTMLVGVS